MSNRRTACEACRLGQTSALENVAVRFARPLERKVDADGREPQRLEVSGVMARSAAGVRSARAALNQSGKVIQLPTGKIWFPTSRSTSRRTPHQRRRSECAGKPRLQQRRQACSKSFRTSVAMVEQFTPKGGEHFLDAPATEPEIDNPAQIGRDTHAFLVDEHFTGSEP